MMIRKLSKQQNAALQTISEGGCYRYQTLWSRTSRCYAPGSVLLQRVTVDSLIKGDMVSVESASPGRHNCPLSVTPAGTAHLKSLKEPANVE